MKPINNHQFDNRFKEPSTRGDVRGVSIFPYDDDRVLYGMKMIDGELTVVDAGTPGVEVMAVASVYVEYDHYLVITNLDTYTAYKCEQKKQRDGKDHYTEDSALDLNLTTDHAKEIKKLIKKLHYDIEP